MTRAAALQTIATAMALAGIAYACALVGVCEYSYERAITDSAQQLADRRSAYDRCVADLRKSAAHANLLDLMIDAKCPVRQSEEPFRRPVILARARRDSALRRVPAIIGIGALPWAMSCASRIKRRRPPHMFSRSAS
jgi:hypothetical protein